MKRALFILGALFSMPWTWAAGPNVLNGGAHECGVENIAIQTLLGAGVVGISLFSDCSNFTSNQIVTPADALNGAATYYDAISGNPVNHAPYAVISNSYAGYTQGNIDQADYASLITNGIVENWAYCCVSLSNGTPPPVAATTVNGVGVAPTGPGIEFGMSAGYKGWSNTTPSANAALFAGVLVAMKFNHSTWTWMDVKGALRQTASNWATGYDPAQYGYGTINYDTANAIASTSSLYLQPPVVVASGAGSAHLTFTIYPARSTRRDHEVLYLVPANYVFPIKNEYVTADLSASGGSLIYTGNNTDLTPTGTVSYSVMPGRYNLIGFTTDNLGNYSRVEQFSFVPVQGQCL